MSKKVFSELEGRFQFWYSELRSSTESVGYPCRIGFGKYAQVLNYCSVTCLINEIAYVYSLMCNGTEKDGFSCSCKTLHSVTMTV